jgi:hypothetical protein
MLLGPFHQLGGSTHVIDLEKGAIHILVEEGDKSPPFLLFLHLLVLEYFYNILYYYERIVV